MKQFFILLAIAISTLSCNNNDPVIINVQDYGITPNTGENITSKINKLIESIGTAPVVISFPKGRYDFYPDSTYMKPYYESNTYDVNPKRLAILIDHKQHIVIDANNSDFIYHDHIQPFTLDNSSNITIKNVNIDWDKPLTAESEVISADSTHILIKIDTAQFPYTIHEKGLTFAAEGWEADWKLSDGSWLMEYDTNHIIPPHTGDFGCVNGDLNNVNYSEKSPGLVLMEGSFTKTPTAGNYLIMRHSTRDHAGMFFFHSKDIILENVNVYHTSGLGILSQYCENISMKRVHMIPNPKKGRYLSGHDDGLHFMGCKGIITIDSCDAQGLMDDPINIHGTYVPVASRINDFTLKCNYAHDMSKGLLWAQQGDSIGFVLKKSMNTSGYGSVKSFSPTEDGSGFILEFTNKLPKGISDAYSLENLTWTPDVSITNCNVGSNRARGYLISTPGKVTVENNTFETSGSAILIAGDANYWFESGAVKDITIRNNKFKAACNSSPYQFCEAVISIYPEIPEPDPAHPYHKNIRIENNSFNMSDLPIVYATSVNGLTFKGNTVSRSHLFEAWHKNKHNFILTACKNVSISENTFNDDVLGKNILLNNMPQTELKNDNGLIIEELVKETE